MVTALIVMASIVVVFAGYLLIAPAALNAGRFARARTVNCPEWDLPARVRLGAWVAGLTSAYGTPRLVLKRCNLLDSGEACAQDCMKTLHA